MAAVIDEYSRAEVEGWRFRSVTTWEPSARHWGFGLLLLALWELLKTSRSRPVVHVHLSERGSFIREGAVVALARLLRLRVIVTLHGGYLSTFAARFGWLVGSVLRLPDLVLTLTAEGDAIVRRLSPRARAVRFVNPVAKVPEPPPPSRCAPVVLFAGGTSLAKGADVLANAWRMVSRDFASAELIVAGPDGGADFSSLDNCRVVGAIPRSELHGLISTSRIVVAPSKVEVMPMFVIEAIMAGRAVIGSDVGAMAELLGSRVGVVIPIDDADALACELARLLGDPDECDRLGAAARSRAEGRHATTVVAARTAAAYESFDGARRRWSVS